MSSTRYSCQILIKLQCSRDFRKIKYQNFVKIRPGGAELLYAGGRTEMTKLIVAFRNFANTPKNVCQNYRPTGVRSVQDHENDACLSPYW
jgi:hypothetical protein